MSDAKPGSETRKTDLERAVDARLASLNSGNYRANSELVLGEFTAFLQRRGVTTLDELSVIDCRRYAQYLRDRVRDPDDPLSASSAHANGPYFTVVRAFLGWCVDDERLESNPARPNRVKSELPEYHGSHNRQFWSVDARDAILQFVDERARDALEADGDRETAYRDRALVTTLALTGVRGAEVFCDPRDEHRPGLTWTDVDLDRGVAVVFGKSRAREEVALPTRVVTVLDRYRRVLDPPSPSWPVFPTRHAPSLAGRVRDELGSRGWSTDEIERELADATSAALLRRHDIAPPALSKNGARSVMKRLCAAAEVTVDGDYLKPHGARRGLGDLLYESDAELAQETLRHRSIETTHAAYRERRAEERRTRIDRVLDGTDATDGD